MQTLSITHKISWDKKLKILFARNPLQKNTAISLGKSTLVSDLSCGAQIEDYQWNCYLCDKERD